MRRVLIVEDDPTCADDERRLLEDLGYEVRVHTDPLAAERELNVAQDLDAVILDIQMPGRDGLDLLDHIKVVQPHLPVIMATNIDVVGKAVEATKRGAYGYLSKPVKRVELEELLNSYFETLARPLVGDVRFQEFLTQHPPFGDIFQRIQSFAQAEVPVLVLGETGTGKGLTARLLHALSLGRRAQPMRIVNIAAVSRSLFESELFGYARGAFTGAYQDRPGLLEAAGGGTLFIDEIGELELDLQSKLLRVLEDRVFQRVGDVNERRCEARLVLATNRDLKAEVEAGRFREDLLYRLSSFMISLPPLRERHGDVPLLADAFFRKVRSQMQKSELQGFSPQTLDLFQRYEWPGNVRELENVVTSAVLIETEPFIRPSSLPDYIGVTPTDATNLREVEYLTVMRVLARHQGNQTRAAEELGIARPTLNRMLKRWRERGLGGRGA